MSAWHRFLEDIERAKASLKFRDGEECFYRGHGSTDWLLLPSLLRHCRKKRITDAVAVRNLESTLFFEFRARARELHDSPLTDWDSLFYMQHFGTPTRLLDWTEVLGVAIYFALKTAAADATPCIWVLNPYRLNELGRGVRDLVAPEYLPEDDYEFSDYLVDFSDGAGFHWDEPVALYPVQRSARLHAQRGYFTIFGNDARPLDQISPVSLQKVPLPRDAMDEARSFLALSGIDEHLLFPDLDGLSRYLCEKYGCTGGG